MRILTTQINPGDIIALGVIISSVAQLLPAMAALLAVVYYGFVIYDRIKYGPELEARLLWRGRKKNLTITEK
jgi:hypothetical protein